MTAPSPIHYWRFDQIDTQSRMATDQIGGRKIEVEKPAELQVDAKKGKGLFFRSTLEHEVDLVEGNDPILVMERWAVALWVKRLGTTAASNGVLFDSSRIDINGESIEPVRIRLEQYSRKRRVGVSLAGQDAAFDYAAPEGEWVHLTFVRDGDASTALYVNGVRHDSLPYAGPFRLQRIGSRRSNGMRAPDAILDELQIFDSALTPEQVRANYDVSVAADPRVSLRVDGQAVDSGGVKDLGSLAEGESRSVQISVTYRGAVNVSYRVEGGNVSVQRALPAGGQELPTPMAVDYDVAIQPTGPVSVTFEVTDTDGRKYTYTVRSGTDRVEGPGLRVRHDGALVSNAKTYNAGQFFKGATSSIELPLRLESIGSEPVTYDISGSDPNGFFTVPTVAGRRLESGDADDLKVEFSVQKPGRWSTLVEVKSNDPSAQKLYFWLLVTVTQ